MKNIKKSVTELDEYIVSQDTSVVKLNQNESSYDIPTSLKKKILSKLAASKWNRYPSGRPVPLINAISKYVGYPADGIVAGNGSNEIIQIILSATCQPKDKIVLVSPGYPIYPRLARIMGLKIVDVPLREDFSFDIPAIIEKSKGARLVAFPSPNSPTGTVLSIEEIKNIANNIEGILIVDEAYCEFHKKTAVGLLKTIDNIIITRTFSKAFGMAGLRLGYLIARPEMAKEIGKVKLPFSVGIFQQIAGEAVAQNKKYIRDIADAVINEREKLVSELRKIPSVKPIPSFANFILFEMEGRSSKDVFESLHKAGVLVRYFATPRLENMLRVTVGTAKENGIFLQKLKIVLGQ
ncbi:MAG: histidinol-phosphate transaminase [Planctomycetota bacterium]